jgi:hypothetical protein
MIVVQFYQLFFERVLEKYQVHTHVGLTYPMNDFFFRRKKKEKKKERILKLYKNCKRIISPEIFFGN